MTEDIEHTYYTDPRLPDLDITVEQPDEQADLRHLRARHLRRRWRLPPDLAAVVADAAFSTLEASR